MTKAEGVKYFMDNHFEDTMTPFGVVREFMNYLWCDSVGQTFSDSFYDDVKELKVVFKELFVQYEEAMKEWE